VGGDDLAHEQEIALRVLGGAKQGRHYLPGGIVNRREQGETRAAPLEPIMCAGIDLYERTRLRPPLPAQAGRSGTTGTWAGNSFPCQNAPHRGTRKGNAFPVAPLLGKMLLVEPDILARCQCPHRLPCLLSHGMRRLSAPIAMHHRPHALAPKPRQSPLRLSRAYAHLHRRFRHRHAAAHHLREHHHPLLFLWVHCHVLHDVTFSLNAYRVT